MPTQWNNTGGRGGARPGAGRKKSAVKEKAENGNPGGRRLEVLDIPEVEGVDMPKPHDFLSAEQRDGSTLQAEEIYKETWEWLQKVGCAAKVSPQLLERYAMCSARWIQCEEMTNRMGFLSKHPTTQKPIPSPFINIGINYMNQAVRLWNEIFQIVKENCSTDYGDVSPQDDLMERLLRARKGYQCGIEDVGDLKVNALERKLKNINPNVHIEKFEGIVQNLPKTMLDEFCVEGDTVFVGCADNRAADVYTNRISIYYSACFISIGFWERAFAGEIFYHVPGKHMPCYECALGEGGNISARAQANHHIYSNQEQTEGVKFEPGISVDINFITTIGIKMIIDMLNLTNENYIPRVLNDLKQYTIVCNTCNPEIGGEMVEIFSYPLQITTSLVVDFCKSGCKEGHICKYEIEEK